MNCQVVLVDERMYIEHMRIYNENGLNCCRDVFGDTAILGDRRWAGAYGVDADFVAGEHCSIARIRTQDIQVNCAVAYPQIVTNSQRQNFRSLMIISARFEMSKLLVIFGSQTLRIGNLKHSMI